MSESFDSALNDLATALAGLRPASPALERDRLLFNAGRASAPRPWAWRLSTMIAAGVAAVLAGVLLLRPAPAPVVSYVYVPVNVPAPKAPVKIDAPPPAPAESEPPAEPYAWPKTPYSRLQDKVLRWGLDGLAEPTPGPSAPPETLDSLLRSL